MASQYAADVIDNSIEDGGFSVNALKRRSSWGDYASSAFSGAWGGGIARTVIKVVGGAAVKSSVNYVAGGSVSTKGFAKDIFNNTIGSALGKGVSKKFQPMNKAGYYFKNYNRLIGKGQRSINSSWRNYSNKYGLIRDNVVGTGWNCYTSK